MITREQLMEMMDLQFMSDPLVKEISEKSEIFAKAMENFEKTITETVDEVNNNINDVLDNKFNWDKFRRSNMDLAMAVTDYIVKNSDRREEVLSFHKKVSKHEVLKFFWDDQRKVEDYLKPYRVEYLKDSYIYKATLDKLDKKLAESKVNIEDDKVDKQSQAYTDELYTYLADRYVRNEILRLGEKKLSGDILEKLQNINALSEVYAKKLKEDSTVKIAVNNLNGLRGKADAQQIYEIVSGAAMVSSVIKREDLPKDPELKKDETMMDNPIYAKNMALLNEKIKNSGDAIKSAMEYEIMSHEPYYKSYAEYFAARETRDKIQELGKEELNLKNSNKADEEMANYDKLYSGLQDSFKFREMVDKAIEEGITNPEDCIRDYQTVRGFGLFYTKGIFDDNLKELEAAKTGYNSGEYKELIDVVRTVNEHESDHPHSCAPEDNDYVKKLFAIKQRINKYISHKAKDGVNHKAFGKLVAVEKLNEIVSKRLAESGVKPFEEVINHKNMRFNVKTMTLSYDQEVAKFNAKGFDKEAPKRLTKLAVDEYFDAAKVNFPGAKKDDLINADNCMCRIITSAIAKGKSDKHIQKLEQMKAEFLEKPVRNVEKEAKKEVENENIRRM